MSWIFITKNSGNWSDVSKTLYSDVLLLEDGGKLLLEDGFKIILEQSVTGHTLDWSEPLRNIGNWSFLNKS
jgi:hypothetical protein